MPGAPECKLSQKGGEYVGTKDRTISGFACVPWLDPDRSEGDMMRGAREGSFPDEVTKSHKICRNPNGNPGGPWCNIKDSRKPNLKWEYCDVSFCDFDDSGGGSKSGGQYESKTLRLSNRLGVGNGTVALCLARCSILLMDERDGNCPLTESDNLEIDLAMML
ncbi:unnamed protein product [Darwinula stevensoni]|uniref:Kringle domain-containing protein n=1 Tax=Darwinula stevensoni TaxID=69355 RepID=A0A7R9ACN2_9CRUS|nr:unnamed protein product [Darwinula stevensoni]CAG0900251.1 unnamed protein product [Darwinula stevensoni]